MTAARRYHHLLWLAAAAVTLSGGVAAIRHEPATVAPEEQDAFAGVGSTAAPPSDQSHPDPSRPAVEAPPHLIEALDAVWRGSTRGCLTVSSGHRVVYEASAEASHAPASVTKLFTATAALEVLGADYRLRTSVRAGARPLEGVISGDLWLVGGGDPVLGTDRWAAQLPARPPLYTSLDQLADRLVRAGVRRVAGRVVGDESRYDTDRYVDTWPRRLIADGEAGPLSALTVNDGFRVWGHPGVAFEDPPADAASVFAELLSARGVVVEGGSAAGAAARSSVEIAAVESATVGELTHAMLRDSDNGTAELLVKELGVRQLGEGSTAAGVRAVATVMGRIGVPLNGVAVADGSGLSDAARATCRSVLAVLTARSADLAPRLALAGVDGTLAHRLVGTPAAGRVRAKTGSLEGVSAIAGYAENAGGTTLAFVYIVTGLPPGSSARLLQDALATALVDNR